MSNEFWVQMIVYAVSIGSFAGVILTKISYLEKKMDKHNGVVERLTRVEESDKQARHEINEIKQRRKE